MNTDLCWFLNGTFAYRKKALASMSKEWLESAILDGEYNRFIAKHADFRNRRIVPYIGCVWRHISFSDPTSIPIGHNGYFVGFMANGVFGYPERLLEEREAMTVIEIVDDAMLVERQVGNMLVERKGGHLYEIEERVSEKLIEVWYYMQTLRVR